MCVCVYVHTYIHTYVRTYIHTDIYLHVYVYVKIVLKKFGSPTLAASALANMYACFASSCPRLMA